jgi:hypothetical protein
MISRREVVTAGVLGTLVNAGTAERSEAQPAPTNPGEFILRDGLNKLDTSVDEFKASVDQGLRGNSMNFGNVGQVKTVIQKYMKAGGRFPEYCDIGLDVFYDVYDWHVRHQQQIQITRMADQRMAIQFMFTQLVLRWENDDRFVGTPYDR